jgi:hypothetical protein
MTHTDLTRPWLIALAMVCAFGGAPAHAACRDDLVAVNQQFERTRADVQKAARQPAAVKCTAYRQHVAALTQVRDVFARCDTGASKAENVGKVAASIGEFNKLAQQTCKR